MENLQKGIRMLFISSVITAICALVTVFSIEAINNIAGIAAIVALVLELIGIIRLSKENLQFKRVIILLILSIALTAIGAILGITFGIIFALKDDAQALLAASAIVIAVVSLISSFFNVLINLFIIIGLKEITNDESTKSLAKIVLFCTVFTLALSGVLGFIATIVSLGWLAIIGTIIGLIGDVCFVVLLAKMDKEFS